MKHLLERFCAAVWAMLGMALLSCGGNGTAEGEADKVAAAYYAEQFADARNTFDQAAYGNIEKWETMENSRKMSVEGRIMTMIMGFYHEKTPDAPRGKYFVMQDIGDGWKVRSMENGVFLTKERLEKIMSGVKTQEKPEATFGPQEQAALEAWKEQFAGRRDFFGHEVTDPAVVANSAERYSEKYGPYVDCFVDSGSESWNREDGGQIRLIVFHEKRSDQFVALVRRQDDGSWAVVN